MTFGAIKRRTLARCVTIVSDDGRNLCPKLHQQLLRAVAEVLPYADLSIIHRELVLVESCLSILAFLQYLNNFCIAKQQHTESKTTRTSYVVVNQNVATYLLTLYIVNHSASAIIISFDLLAMLIKSNGTLVPETSRRDFPRCV